MGRRPWGLENRGKYSRPEWEGLLSAPAIRARNPLTNGVTNWPILDSEDAVLSFGPSQIGTSYTGTYEVFQQGVIFTTPCDMQPGLTEVRSLKFYAVDCLPEWNIMPEDVIRRFPPGDPILIDAPASIRLEVMAAAQAWKTWLASHGVTIDFVEGACGPAGSQMPDRRGEDGPRRTDEVRRLQGSI